MALNSHGPILFCQCAYANVIPPQVKQDVLERLVESGVAFDAVADLCALSAAKDPSLGSLAVRERLRIVACYPRAVKSLFAAAGAPLPVTGVEYLNMRDQSVLDAAHRLLGPSAPSANVSGTLRVPPEKNGARSVPDTIPVPAKGDGRLFPVGWKPWFPVIDYDRCTNCMQCLSFCLFDVYGVTPEARITVLNPANCKTDCPACSRVCPEVAIIFPKYKAGPINGDEVSADDVRRETMKIDVSALLGGDIYSMLRDRSARVKSRFSKERDDGRALEERQRCLATFQQEMKDWDIPPEVISSLPSADQIREKAEAARRRSQEALAMKPLDSASRGQELPPRL
jgi:NAD-dependent dihydropyrimidine dehydrogenase PreA subunit